MSERLKVENARRKGRRAARDGLPITSNPMRAQDSRREWTRAFVDERAEAEARSAALTKRVGRRSARGK